jgi:hypothetical protein
MSNIVFRQARVLIRLAVHAALIADVTAAMAQPALGVRSAPSVD